MDKISAPTPQISHLIRTHGFVVHSSVSPNWIRRQELGDCRYPAGSLKWAQRHYEQDVYDLARCLGHSMDEAEGWALQAREFCSEKKHLKDETAKTEQLLAESNYGLRVEIDRMEAADKTKEQKSVQKDAKKARIADSKVQGKARRQAERENAQNSNDHQTGRPEEQEPWTSNVGHPLDDQALNEQDKPQQQRKKGRKRKTETFEHPPNVQALNDQDKPHQQRKKGRKRKSDHELPVQSEVPDEHDKHKKRRMDDRQDDNSKQTKSKKGGPEHSPFFQRSSGSKAKKDSGEKAEQQKGFQPPMI